MAEVHDVRDQLLEPAAEEQRKRGMMPTVEANESYIKDILRKMDRKKAESKPNIVTNSERKENDVMDAIKKRCRTEGWTLERTNPYTQSVPLAHGGSPVVVKTMDEVEKALRQRCKLLYSKPEWRIKFQCINKNALDGSLGIEKQKEASRIFVDLINKSNAVFGDWDKPPPDKPKYSYEGQVSRG